MQHFFPNVPKLGHVAVSRHAQERMARDGISELQFKTVLHNTSDPDIREPGDIICRQSQGVRIVILEKPKPFHGAKLVKTVIKLKAPARATT